MTKLLSAVNRTIPILGIVLFSVCAQSEPIVGIGNAGGFSSSGVLYSINPLNGSVTAIGPSGTTNWYYPVSSGPVAGSYFALSPINHYLIGPNEPIGTNTPPFGQWECYSCFTIGLGDFAFDPSNGELFSLSITSNGTQGLVQLTNTGRYFGGCPVPNCYNLTASFIAQAPAFPALTLIEYINGLGLYGTDGHAAYLINEKTDETTQLPSLAYGGPIITGLADDPDSGRLIGVSGTLLGAAGSTSDIYNIDPLSGAVTLLNSNAPDMFGIAAVSTPEPSSIFPDGRWNIFVVLSALLQVSPIKCLVTISLR